MKKFVLSLFSAAALVLGACQSWQPAPVSQRWFLGNTDFHGTRPDMSLKISYAEMAGNKIRLYVHVVDTSQRFVQGIPPEIFCEMALYQDRWNYMTGYRVTEYRQADRGQAAFAFVLDHSGSMGSNKTRLYHATRELINNKREGDAYSIVRYADYTSLDVPLTADKGKLLSEFLPTPLVSVGNMTATWDGVIEGIETLENTPYTNRTLVVFTDGGENASKVTQAWAFWRAKKAGIKVVTVCLGTGGSQNMKDLSESTGGMYTQIDNISDISNVYADLLNKQNSFYLVEFETPLQGRQSIRLNLCADSFISDVFTFDNSPAGDEPLRLKEDAPPGTSRTTYNGGGYTGTVYTGPIYTGGSSGTSYGGGSTRGSGSTTVSGGGRSSSSSGSGTVSGGSYGGGRGGDGGTSTGRGGSSSNGPSTGRGGTGGGTARP